MKMKYLLICLSLMAAFQVYGQNFPFPQHVSYVSGVIKPNHVAQATLDQQLITYYNTWKSRYLVAGCNPGDYYIFYNYEGTGTNISISEGQGFGMVIVALMAGYDPNAKAIFDGLFHYYNTHPSSINPVFMNWRQKSPNCVSNGDDSATDGDLDAAYALLLADKQWGSDGAINYLTEAQLIINAVMDDLVHPTYLNIQLGDWVSGNTGLFPFSTRTSDFMTDHFRVFKNATQNAGWDAVTNKCYALITHIQATKSTVTGLLPDFIKKCNTTNPVPAQANFLEGPYDGQFYYNACRDPWRIGTDAIVNGTASANTALTKINNWIKTKTGNDPSKIRSGYTLAGGNTSGNNYQDLAFIAPFGVSGMISSNNQAWINAIWNKIINTPPATSGYYGNTIALQCLITMSGNWWTPVYAPLLAASSEPEIVGFGKPVIKAYPNPTSDLLHFEFNEVQARTISLRVFDAQGKVVKTFTQDTPGIITNSIELNINDLESGNYFWQLLLDDVNYSGNAVILKQ